MALPNDVITVLGAATGGTATAISTATKKRNVNQAEAYLLREGYNPHRQFQIEIATHAELERLAGRKVEDRYYDTKMAITEILEKEGFKYFDKHEIRRTDPYYRMYAGLPTSPGDVTFADLRKKMSPEEKKLDNEAQIAGIFALVGIFFLICLPFGLIAIVLELLS